jgi:hypothetical protein
VLHLVEDLGHRRGAPAAEHRRCVRTTAEGRADLHDLGRDGDVHAGLLQGHVRQHVQPAAARNLHLQDRDAPDAGPLHEGRQSGDVPLRVVEFRAGDGEGPALQEVVVERAVREGRAVRREDEVGVPKERGERREERQLDRPLPEGCVAGREVALHRLLVERRRLALLDHDRVLRAVAQAGAEAVAVTVVDQAGLPVDDLDRAFRAGRDAEPATVALLFDEPDHGALHDDLLCCRGKSTRASEEAP